MCIACDSSDEHEQHEKEDILKVMAKKKELTKKDLQDLEKSIYPKYLKAEKTSQLRELM